MNNNYKPLGILIAVTLSVMVAMFASLAFSGDAYDNTDEKVDLVPFDGATIEPVVDLGHGLYLCRITTRVDVRIMGRNLTIPQYAYVKLNAGQIRRATQRIKEADDRVKYGQIETD